MFGGAAMSDSTTFFELRCSSKVGILAVPYRRRRPRKALRLPDGAIVEAASLKERRHVPDRLIACIGVAVDGEPATIHHENLGLVTAFILLEGVYLLSSGEVAAVYGAEAVALN